MEEMEDRILMEDEVVINQEVIPALLIHWNTTPVSTIRTSTSTLYMSNVT
jgi:hypothetical protein